MASRLRTRLRASTGLATPSLNIELATAAGGLDPRVTFSRGTQATLTDSTGKITYAPNNLLTNSESFEATAWTTNSGTVTANVGVAPDGTTTADQIAGAASSGGIYRFVTVVNGGRYTASVYAKYVSGSTNFRYGAESSPAAGVTIFNISAGTVVSNGADVIASSITSVGNGWYRCAVTFVATSTSTGLVCYASGSAGTWLQWGAQLEQVTYQTTPSTYNSTTPKNLLGYTQEFDNAAWTKSNSFVQTNLALTSTFATLAGSAGSQYPSGTGWSNFFSTGGTRTFVASSVLAGSQAMDIASVSAARNVIGFSFTPSASTTYTVSFYVESVSGATGIVAYATGTLGTGGTTNNVTAPTTTGRYSYTFTTGTASGTVDLRFGIGCATNESGSLRISNVQVVQGATAGDYQPTYAAAAAVQYAAPDGTLSADKLVEDATANVHFVLRSGSGTVGVTEVLSCYAKAAERSWVQLQLGASPGASAYFNLATGTVGTTANGTATITAVGNGWYRCSIAATRTGNANNFINIATADGVSSYTGDGTSGIYVWGAQLSNSASLDPYVYNPGAAPTSAAYYGPRFDYDPVTLAPKGLLIEEQRTNLALQSGSCASAPWVGDTSGGSIPTVTANYAVAPDGTTTATRVQINRGAGTFSRWAQNITASSATYTASIWMRTTSGTGTANVGLRVDATGVNCVVTGTWQRFSVTTSTASTAPSIQVLSFTSIAGTDVSADVLIWGGQVEAGAFATSYIPTVASTVTRSADVAQMLGDNFSSWYNQTQGTFVAEWDSSNPITVNTSVVTSANDNTNNNYVELYQYQALTAGSIYNGGVLQADIARSSPAVVPGTIYKAGMAFITDSVQYARSGTLGTQDNSATLPAVDRLSIGSRASARFINGHIRSIQYYNTRLTDTQLQVLST